MGPLFKAVVVNDIDRVRALIASGEGVNETVAKEITPLFMAAQAGNEEMVGVLIGAGAKINKSRDTGETPLYCCTKGSS